VITVPPVPPPCTRPIKLNTYTLVTGYNILVPPSTVVSTGSQIDACAAIAYVTSSPDFTYTSIQGEAFSLSVGQVIYASNGTNDCSVIPDGWYFTDESANTTTAVYHVVSGILTEIVICVPTTTTTTTLACNSYTAYKTTVGIVTVTYTDCTGVASTINVGNSGGGPSTVTFCARCCPNTPPEVTLTNNGIC
jgi:hypothetical protein